MPTYYGDFGRRMPTYYKSKIITKDTYEYELVSVYEWEDFDKNSK